MKLLLDTHTALWWVNKHETLSHKARAMLLDRTHSLHISVVSVWEIAIKVSLGKIHEFNGGVKAFLEKLENSPVTLLPVAPRHVEIVEALPFIHRDPFDRLLVATAQAEGMTILTADANIRKYAVPSVW
ncbi:MAG: type II toxin-antitoxin system VapC family toxin [Kiritimatiellaeota bacterium]|nr:type II toxin-antitoxin system VapC family toxin [Kiritimatiellota bacterium]